MSDDSNSDDEEYGVQRDTVRQLEILKKLHFH